MAEWDKKSKLTGYSFVQSFMVLVIAVLLIMLGGDNLTDDMYDFQKNVPRFTRVYRIQPFHDYGKLGDLLTKGGDETFNKGVKACSDRSSTTPSGCLPWNTFQGQVMTASTCNKVSANQQPDGCTCLLDAAGQLFDFSSNSGTPQTVNKTMIKDYQDAMVGCVTRGQMPSTMHAEGKLSPWVQVVVLFSIASLFSAIQLYNYNAGWVQFVPGAVGVAGLIIAVVMSAVMATATIDIWVILVTHLLIALVLGVTYKALDTQHLDECFHNCYIQGWFLVHAIPQYLIIIAALRTWTDLDVLYHIITIGFFIGLMLMASNIIRWAQAKEKQGKGHRLSEDHLFPYVIVLLLFAIFAYAWVNLPLPAPGTNGLNILLTIAIIIFILLLTLGIDLYHVSSERMLDSFCDTSEMVEFSFRVAVLVVFFCFFALPDAVKSDGSKLLVP